MKTADRRARRGRRLRTGELAPGDRLPAERELAARARCQPDDRSAGAADPRVSRAASTSDRAQRRLVRRAAEARTRLGTFSGCPSSCEAGVAAGRGSCRPARRTARSRSCASGSPTASRSPSNARASADRFAGLLALDLTGSLYDLLDEHFDAAPVRAVERIEPVLADAEEAEALGLPVGAPLMLVDRTAYDAAGVVVETARDVFRGRPHEHRRVDSRARGSPCEHRRHRRWDRRRQLRLPPREGRRAGRRAGGEGRADERLDASRGGARDAVQPLADDDAVPPLQRGALPGARRLRDGRVAADRVEPREPARAPPRRQPRPRHRPRGGAGRAGRGAAAPAGGNLGLALRCGLDAGRRIRRPAHRNVCGRERRA